MKAPCTVPASFKPTVRIEASCCSSSLICHGVRVRGRGRGRVESG